MNREIFFTFLVSLWLIQLNFNLISTTQTHSEIHFLTPKPNDYLKTHRNSKKNISTTTTTTTTKSSKLCHDIFSTYSFMGKNSMDIYSSCKGKYELIGYKDEIMIKDSPFCYINLSNFFCHYRVIKNESQQFTCGNENLIEFILTLLKGCIAEAHAENENNENLLYKCSSLSLNSYKIENPTQFCDSAEKKERKVGFDGLGHATYSTLKEPEKPICKIISEMYNACIDADNLIYPKSNYQSCFSKSNPIYYCNKLEKYTTEEQELCLNFILPTFASKTLHENVIDADNDFCYDFESTVMKEYEKFIKLLRKQNEDHQNVLEEIARLEKNTNTLRMLSNTLLNSTSYVTKEWLDFYAEMSANFKIRAKLTEVEFTSLSKLRLSFDTLFPFSANLNSISKDKQFILANFTTLYTSIFAYYSKMNVYLLELESIIENFNSILQQNRKLTYAFSGNAAKSSNFTENNKQEKDNDNDNDNDSFMVSYILKKEDISAFQNEFVQMIQYLKTFLNQVMKKIKEADIAYSQRKLRINSSIEANEKYIKRIESQRNEFYKQVLS